MVFSKDDYANGETLLQPLRELRDYARQAWKEIKSIHGPEPARSVAIIAENLPPLPNATVRAATGSGEARRECGLSTLQSVKLFGM